jgi:glucose-6-phosphate 1-dehydrogenase
MRWTSGSERPVASGDKRPYVLKNVIRERNLPMSMSLVIFGASGDLTSRKLVPSLYSLFRKGRLPDEALILGFATSPLTNDSFRQKMKEGVQLHAPEIFREQDWRRFASHLFYQPGNFDRPEDFTELEEKLRRGGPPPTRTLFYLAIAPSFFPVVVRRLSEAGMLAESEQRGLSRIVIEKPFGRDLRSALALNKELHGLVRENQIYRIDHYLGKETVQNVLVLRFANAIFEPLWNRNYIDHVQITVAEKVGIGHRARYYEQAGVLRDMFQNHLMQLLTLVAMEPPAVYEADALRNEKVKILTALREVPREVSARQTVRAQYEGYTREENVHPDSSTETYAALKVFVDNWRWQGVPFYLRSGKMLKMKVSEILVQFRRPPTQILDVQSGMTELFTNGLSICIQPDEGMHLRFITKVPDEGLRTRHVNMDFHYRDSFGDQSIPEAYERLLLDAMNGDASLFARSDEIELSWDFIDTIRAGWEGDAAPPLERYARGSWGPEAAEHLLWRDGRWWIHDCRPHGSGESDEERA